MIRRKPFTWLGLVVAVALGTAALPRTSAAQSVKDTGQQILDLLRSWGDVTRSWSAALPAEQRFVVLAAFNNEAVLDRNTGLVWERTVYRSGRHWQSALYACYSAETGGQMGWRLPSISEFTSLVDPASTNPALPPGSPFDIGQHAFFWSATTRFGFTDLAWGFNLRDGFIDDYEFPLLASTWCVRGGTSSDPH